MKTILLTKGKVALVDDEDFDFLNQWEWCASQAGRDLFYAERCDTTGRKRLKIKMHRLLMRLPETVRVDHKDRNSLNNQKHNLRAATHANNCANTRLSNSNTSGFKGVDWDKQARKWRARISIGTQHSVKTIGHFDNPKDAAKAYDDAAIRIAGEFAATNKALGLL